LQSRYKNALGRSLSYKKLSLLIITLLLILSALCYQSLPKALAPNEDQGYILGIMSPPQSASLNYTYPYTKSLEAIYDGIAEKKGYLTVTTPNNIFSVLRLAPWESRTRSQKDISQEINHGMQQLTGVSGFAVSPSPLGRRGENNGFQMKVMSYASLDKLEEAVKGIESELKKYPGLNNVDDDLSVGELQFEINFNRALMAELNIPMSESSNLISTMLSGRNPGEFSFNGQGYPMYLQLNKSLRTDPSVIKKLYLQTESHGNIPLSQVAKIQSNNGPMSLNHYNKMKSADIVAELAPNMSYGKVIKDVNEILKRTLPDTVKVTFTGSAKDYLDSKSSTLSAFLLALLFIFLILAAQFESFMTPFIILLTVPGSMLGGLGALTLASANINIYSSMGLVTLIGLISKHGILIIEFCEQNLRKGFDLKEAIIEGAALRLRPILMTTLAMVLGAAPLLLAHGAGAEARRQLGMVIVGGMSLGTLFSLFIVPMSYFTIYSAKPFLKKRLGVEPRQSLH
jgi:multidrug efflux pump